MNELQSTKLINFQTLRKAFGFYLSADTPSKSQHAFIQELCKEVFFNKRNYYALDKIDTLRDQLKRNTSKIQHQDFGAGSQYNTKEKSIASFVRTSASDKYKGQVLFHLARQFNAHNILELGTNLGLGTAYLASANSNSNVKSLEGCPNLSEVARKILKSTKIFNTEIIAGQFSDTLWRTCQNMKEIDLAFIDGDHSYDSTIGNYQTLKPFLHKNSVVIFDDIYWSEGMTKAWDEIRTSKEVTLSIDIYRMGIVFFDEELDAQNLKLISSKLTPWR